MKLNLAVILAFSMVTLSGAANAASTVFKTRDANGNPIFSDQAGEDAEEIKVQTPQTFESPPTPQFQLNADPEDEVTVGPAYERLEILSPQHESAFRNNAGNITVQIAIEPALQANHTLELILDGQVAKAQKAGGPILLENVDRGTHQFQARIIEDQSGETLQTSNSVTATLQRVSIIKRTN
ncbi:MAG: DUF4124 domain-containing protein [Pseudomonadales bacterium]